MTTSTVVRSDDTATSLKGEALAAASTSADFYAQMEAAKVVPLWDRFNRLTPPEPTSPDKGTQWRWRELAAIVDRAARDVSMEHAERRGLMLVNPIFDGRIMTTTGLYGALQVLLPGEVARVHRHTASAFRFIIEGRGGITRVNGKDCPMNEGDVVLTPNWAWHEHSNPGSERVCWYDGLDVPLLFFYNAWFAEHGPERDTAVSEATLPDAAHVKGGLRPVSGLLQTPYSPRMRFPWEDVVATFAAMPAEADGHRLLRYSNPATGGAVMPTMDLYAMKLTGGAETRARRATHNTVCVVAQGRGHSQIGETHISWEKGDVFTVPHWRWTSHHAEAVMLCFFNALTVNW